MSAVAPQQLERRLEWSAPTGRRLVPGTVFRHRRFGGRWRFLSYVEHPTAPHVEAIAVSGNGGVRAFDPADVYGVSNAKGGAR